MTNYSLSPTEKMYATNLAAIKDALRASLKTYDSTKIWKDSFKQPDIVEWPSICVIIPVFNSPELLHLCISSLKTTMYGGNVTIVFVDNASTDTKTHNMLNNQKHVIRLDTPSEFSYAINTGIKANPHADFYVLFNQDCEVIDKQWLNRLIEFMVVTPSCGICGPKLVFPSGKIQQAGIEIPRGTIGQHRFAQQKSDLIEANFYEKVQAVTGAVFCIRKDTLDNIGLFDEEYKFGCEDTEFCLRASCLGWEVWYIPTSVVRHREGGVRNKIMYKDTRITDWINISHTKFRREWGALVDNLKFVNDKSIVNIQG